MTSPPWTIAEVNRWDHDEFVAHFGGLFEHSPWIVETAWADRPFASRTTLHQALTEAVSGADSAQQLALIRAHPDLVGRAALAGTLTRESTGEQRAAGLDPGRLTPGEITRFTALNTDYKSRFEMPFVICARDNSKDSILTAFTTRLTNDRPVEIATALAEIAKICWYRLCDIVE